MQNLDTLVFADRVHTLDESAPTAEAIGIAGGRVVVVGTRRQASSWPTGEAVTIEFDGATVVPGLVDSHIHPVVGIEMTNGIDLSSVTSIGELRARLAAEAADRERDWVVGWGLDPNAFECRPMHFALFEDVLRGKPALLRLFDGHQAMASKRALELASVTGSQSFNSKAKVVCDVDGAPTGLLNENEAIDTIAGVLPELPIDNQADRLLDLLDAMAASGLTGGHVMDSSPKTLAIVRAAEAKRDLGIRLRISPWILAGADDSQLPELLALQGSHGRRWRIEGIKLFIDGTIDNGTAWLEEPDTQGESTSSVWLDPDRYAAIQHYFAGNDIPTATHAIGDAGVRFAAETIATAPGNARHRIEHIETLPTETIDLFVRGGIAASMQPTHCTHYTRADQTDNWSRRLGPERAGRAFRIKSLRRSGVTVALGSDWPIAPFEPLATMADAALRRPAGKPSIAPVRPEQAITVREALEGYTTQIAASIGDPSGGRIAVGQPANLTILAADPLNVSADDLSATEVVATMIDGEVSFDRRILSDGDEAASSPASADSHR